MGFFMALFAGLFQASIYGTGDLDVIYVYEFIIKTLGCVLLACSANVMKTLFAKLLSNHFYRDSYFEKMQDALCKASLATPSLNGKVHVLCQDCRSFLPSPSNVQCHWSQPQASYTVLPHVEGRSLTRTGTCRSIT